MFFHVVIHHRYNKQQWQKWHFLTFGSSFGSSSPPRTQLIALYSECLSPLRAATQLTPLLLTKNP